MRRLPSVLLLGAVALSTTAFAPAVQAPSADAARQDAERQIVVCVKFRDWEVPATGITWEAPHERFCIETRDVVVPFPGGNPMPGTLPGAGDQE